MDSQSVSIAPPLNFSEGDGELGNGLSGAPIHSSVVDNAPGLFVPSDPVETEDEFVQVLGAMFWGQSVDFFAEDYRCRQNAV